MEHIINFCNRLSSQNITELKNTSTPDIFTSSIEKFGDSIFFMAKVADGVILVEYNVKGTFINKFEGNSLKFDNKKIRLIKKTEKNATAMREIFKFTKPISVKDKKTTFGCGDRLGIATPGHIRAIRKYNITPILAQQSIRELNFTNRTFQSVLDDVSWAVFQENYKDGFGADGDHLKNHQEVQLALNSGMTFITVDLSEYINNTISNLSEKETSRKYKELSQEVKLRYEKKYLNKKISLRDLENKKIPIVIDEKKLTQFVLIYDKAISFAKIIYNDLIKQSEADYEISIDETVVPTIPEAHFIFANELIESGINIFSIAPRFCGIFQKGIDYIGDINEFEKEFIIHSSIANNFGYKLSIHSGSDKYSIYPIISKYTNQRFHLKTSGTSWIEAVKLIAIKNPKLYREIHTFCLENYQSAKKYYHISENRDNIPDINRLSDDELPSLFNNADLRQIIHICYSLLLNVRESENNQIFKNKIFSLLNKEYKAHYNIVNSHLKKHIQTLGISSNSV